MGPRQAGDHGVGGPAQFPDQHLELLIAVQGIFEFARFLAGQSAQHVKAGLGFSSLVDHTMPLRLSRSLSIPRRMRALTVPRGCWRVSAISFWVKPPRKAISMACRCSRGSSATAERMRVACSWV